MTDITINSSLGIVNLSMPIPLVNSVLIIVEQIWRKIVTVNNPTENEYTNFPVYHVMTTFRDGKMPVDFGNVRFYDENNTELETYQDEAYWGSTAYYDILVPHINPGSNPTKLIMRYGWADETIKNRPENLFLLYEDFENGLDLNKWEAVNESDMEIVQEGDNNLLRIYKEDQSQWNIGVIYKPSLYLESGVKLNLKHKVSGGNPTRPRVVMTEDALYFLDLGEIQIGGLPVMLKTRYNSQIADWVTHVHGDTWYNLEYLLFPTGSYASYYAYYPFIDENISVAEVVKPAFVSKSHEGCDTGGIYIDKIKLRRITWPQITAGASLESMQDAVYCSMPTPEVTAVNKYLIGREYICALVPEIHEMSYHDKLLAPETPITSDLSFLEPDVEAGVIVSSVTANTSLNSPTPEVFIYDAPTMEETITAPTPDVVPEYNLEIPLISCDADLPEPMIKIIKGYNYLTNIAVQQNAIYHYLNYIIIEQPSIKYLTIVDILGTGKINIPTTINIIPKGEIKLLETSMKYLTNIEIPITEMLNYLTVVTIGTVKYQVELFGEIAGNPLEEASGNIDDGDYDSDGFVDDPNYIFGGRLDVW